MESIRSKDGTLIAFERSGAGPALILVTGAFTDHQAFTQLVLLLEPHFTVFNYDRRGRGDSGDTQPYAVEREIDDIAALIDAAGGSANLYGASSGAILALEVARSLASHVARLALFEPPFIVNDSRPPLPSDFVEQLDGAVAAGRRGDAVEIILTQALMLPADEITTLRAEPTWADLEKVAHTLAYDGRIQRDFMLGKPLPRDRWDAVTVPTLVMSGENSDTFFHDGTRALVDILPNAQYRLLAAQEHAVDPQAVAPVLVEFFTAARR